MRTIGRVALGLFILWQLFFLLTQNFLGLAKATRSRLPEDARRLVETVAPGWTQKQGAAHEVVEAVTKRTGCWAQLTGQLQSWSLFAPDVGDSSIFPLVELRWDEPPPAPWDAPRLLAPLAADTPLPAIALVAGAGARGETPARSVLLPSANEPQDPLRYLRLGLFRQRRYEGYLRVDLADREDEAPVARNKRWQLQLEARLRQEWDTLRAYLRWRIQSYLREHPDKSRPRQVILHLRRYQIRPPDASTGSPWDGPERYPWARWRPGSACPPYYLPVEVFSPLTQEFEWLHGPGDGDEP